LNIPAFINVTFTDKEGKLTPAMQFYNDQLNQVLFNGVGPNGFTVSQLTTADITTLAANVNIPLGTVWYNTSINKLQVKTAPSVVETISSS